MYKVRKRNGNLVPFDISRIENAIRGAFTSCRITISDEIIEKIAKDIPIWDEITVEEISDQIEEILEDYNYHQVAKEYILYREYRKALRDKVQSYLDFIENYKKSDNTANATIDANANVANHNIAVLNAEIHKESNQDVNMRILRDEVRKLYPDFDYKQMDKDFNTIAYLHDANSQIIMPYCVSISLYPFLINGIKDLGGLSASPRNIESFCGMFVNMIFAIASQFKGACLYKDQELIINGKFIKIKDLVSSYNLDHSFVSDKTEWEYANVDNLKITEYGKEVPISKVYRRKYKDLIYRIETKTGDIAYTSKDHVFKTIRDGKEVKVTAENLHLYDTVFVDNDISYALDINSQEYKRNFILGLLMGDGCLTKEDCIGLSVNYEQEYLLYLYNMYSKELFGIELNNNAGHKCYNAQKRNKEYKDKICSYLTGLNTFDKCIKSEFLNTINECCGFLDGLMCADGSDNHSFSISLVNKNLIDACCIVLFKLGLRYTYRVVPAHDNKNTLYCLNFSSCANVYLPNFCKRINRKIDRDFYYYNSGYSKKWTHSDKSLIESSKTGGERSFCYDKHVDVIIDITSFENDDDYVYEIETESHWYSCGGIITHNCATPGFLLCMDYFIRKRYGNDYYKNLDMDVLCSSIEHRTLISQISQWFQQVTYSINQPSSARGAQSVFWNLSFFDKPFYEGMYGDFYFPDGTKPIWESFNFLQQYYLHWLNEERLKCMLTFPVCSYALIYKNGEFADKEASDFVAQEYSEGNSFFTYLSDSVDSLSSCCRLQNKLSDNTFNFTNGQIGEQTGSLNVITLNMNRIVQDYKKQDKLGFHDYLCSILDRIYKYQTAYKSILVNVCKAHLFPAYDAGFINMDRQYLTIGVNGLNQAAEFLGIKCTNNNDYAEFCHQVFGIIKEQNTLHKTSGLMFNTEQTPCENAAIKLYNRDKKDGYWVPEDTNLYASYVYKPNDESISVLDKFVMHGDKFLGSYCDGGQAAHINLDSHLDKTQYKLLLKFAGKVGCKYFTFNVPNCECEDCGFIAKQPFKKCPKCGSTNVSLWDRVIGYLTKIKNWSKGRQIEQKTRVYSKL